LYLHLEKKAKIASKENFMLLEHALWNLTVISEVIHSVLPHKGSIPYKYCLWKQKHTK
jgi:hypothetical protein